MEIRLWRTFWTIVVNVWSLKLNAELHSNVFKFKYNQHTKVGLRWLILSGYVNFVEEAVRCHWLYQICACSPLSSPLRVSADCGIVDGALVRSGHQMLLREDYQTASCVRLASWGLWSLNILGFTTFFLEIKVFCVQSAGPEKETFSLFCLGTYYEQILVQSHTH